MTSTTNSTVPLVGVLRPASASTDPVVALAEARVVRHELARRLGEVGVDLRAAGGAHSPWGDVVHAAWPSGVDAIIELDEVTGEGDAQLASLFGRTLDPDAVEVRRRMLTHLGILPVERLDDDALAERLPPPRRPTDVWILLRDADEVVLSDPRLRTLADDDTAATTTVDEWFDRVVDGLDIDTAPTIARLQRRVEDLERELAATAGAAARAERLAVERLDELSAECGTLRERLERTMLDAEVS